MSMIHFYLIVLTVISPSFAALPKDGVTYRGTPKLTVPCNQMDAFSAIRGKRFTCLRQNLLTTDVNEIDKEGQTLLHVAIANENIPAISELVRRGADLHQINYAGQTPIRYAEFKNQREVAEKLEQLDIEYSRLQESIERGDIPSVRASLVRGVAIGNRDTRLDSVLHRTVMFGDSAIAAELIKRGAAVNAQNYLGETPLFQAVLLGKIELVRVLLRGGANPNILDKRRESCLDIADAKGLTEIASLLKHAGAKKGAATGVDLEITSSEGVIGPNGSSNFN